MKRKHLSLLLTLLLSQSAPVWGMEGKEDGTSSLHTTTAKKSSPTDKEENLHNLAMNESEGDKFIIRTQKLSSLDIKDIENKDITLLVEPTGAGKSTLLNLIAGNTLTCKKNDCDDWEIFSTPSIATIGHGDTSETFLPNTIASETFAMYEGETEDVAIQAKPYIAPRKSFSRQEIACFFEKGYIIIPKLFSAEEINELSTISDSLQRIAEDTLAKSVREAEEKIDYEGTQFVMGKTVEGIQIKRIVWAAAVKPRLLELARQTKVTHRVADLLGNDEADQLICQLHLKIPGDRVEFDWHQDVQFRRTFDQDWHDINGKGSFVQVITAIDEMNEENGPLKIIPRMPEYDLCLDKIKDKKELEKKVEAQTALQIMLNPGDTLFMHPHLIHGSALNTSTSMKRRIFINGFSYPGANHKPYPGRGSTERIVLNSYF